MIADTVIAKAKAFSVALAMYPGLCLKFVRTCLGIPAKYPSAIAAWRAIPGSKKHTGYAPKGYPMFYNIGIFGHVVISNGDGKNVWSNITADHGYIKLVIWTMFGKYLGWATQLNGVDIKFDEPPKPPAKPPAWRNAPYGGRVIKPGVKGNDVKELQFHMGHKVTGVLSTIDAAAIDKFVLANNRRYPRGTKGYLGAADHTAGPKTYKAMTGHA